MLPCCLARFLKIQKIYIDDAGDRVRTASSTSFYVKAMDLVKQWSAGLCYEQAKFLGRVTLSCSVNNNQSYRLSVLLQYNLLTHCEQFKYPNLIIILKINYLSCHRCSPNPPPHKTPNRSKVWFVSGYEMDHFLVTTVPGKKGVRRVTFPGHCISVTCTAAEHHRGGKCKKKVL